MDCTIEIEINEPKESKEIFPPQISFKIIQVDFSSICLNEEEIDENIDMFIKEIDKKRKVIKNELRKAIKRHDKLLSK